jgi:hypothetical protein
MGHFLSVISGVDDGKSCLIGQGEVLIGRSPTATMVLKDETVSWEHAVVLESEGKLIVRNLSALGTRVRGRRVTGDTKLSPNDEIELSPTCKLLVVSQDEVDKPTSPLTIALIAAVALLILGGAGIAMFLLNQDQSRPMTGFHWRQAYTRLNERVERWEAERLVPSEIGDLLRDGWRYEQIENFKGANERWLRLSSMLLTLRSRPITGDELTFAESTPPSKRALHILMGWDTSGRSGAPEWNSDDAYADALVWFARQRAETTRKTLEEIEKKAKGSGVK